MFLLVPAKLYADGPPIDTLGNIRCEFLSIKLDDAQIQHLQSHRWLTLTPLQREQLKSLHLPKYIDVFGPFHGDCTCGQVYGMWYRIDSLAFCKRNLQPRDSLEYDYDMAWYNDDKNFQSDSQNFHIGSAGRIIHNNQVVSNDNIYSVVDSLTKARNERYIIVYQPPINKNPNAAAVRQAKRWIESRLPAGIKVYWM